jgi:hypothetical protein
MNANSFSRRALLRTTVLVPVAVAVTACGSTNGGPSLSQLAQDVQTLAAGVGAILPLISNLSGISGSIMSTVQSALADINEVAAAVGAGGSTITVANLSTDVGTILKVLTGSGVTVPSTVTTILQAAMALLPTILSAAGVALSGLAAAAPTMSAEQARAALRQAAMGR